MKKKINKQRLKEQLRLGAMALGLALIVWVIAKSGETREARLTVPIVVTSPGPQVEVEVMPQEIEVLVRYGQEASPYISSDNFKFVVDPESLRDNLDVSWQYVTISLSDKNWNQNIPSGRVDLAKIGSQSSTVKVGMRYAAIPAIVKPDIVGLDALPAGYQLVSPVKVNPREVFLIGDSDKLAELPRDELTSRVVLKTTPISVAGLTDSSLEQAEIILEHGVSIVQRNTNMAEVTLEVQEVQTVREIKNIPLDFQAIAPDTITMKYSPKVASVRIFGPQSALRQVTPDSFRVNMVRPQEEVPGTKVSVPLEVHFSLSVSDEIRNRVQIQGIEPSALPVEYTSKDTGGSDSSTTATAQSSR